MFSCVWLSFNPFSIPDSLSFTFPALQRLSLNCSCIVAENSPHLVSPCR